MTKTQPEASRNANIALDYIGRLYGVERDLREQKIPPTAAERLEARQRRSRPIMVEFRNWLDEIAPKLLPESKFGKAVHYALGQWSKLQVYIDDPAVPIGRVDDWRGKHMMKGVAVLRLRRCLILHPVSRFQSPLVEPDKQISRIRLSRMSLRPSLSSRLRDFQEVCRGPAPRRDTRLSIGDTHCLSSLAVASTSAADACRYNVG